MRGFQNLTGSHRRIINRKVTRPPILEYKTNLKVSSNDAKKNSALPTRKVPQLQGA